MMNIDVERIIDAVEEESNSYFDYCKSVQTLYKGPFEEFEKRKNHLEYANNYHDRQQTAVYTLIEVFNLDQEAQERLYAAARAVRRWREDTNWERLMPDTMQDQLKLFIFGAPAAPSFACKRCAYWQS